MTKRKQVLSGIRIIITRYKPIRDPEEALKGACAIRPKIEARNGGAARR